MNFIANLYLRLGLGLLIAGALCLTSCKEKARLTEEIAEKRAVLAEMKEELNGLKETYAKTPSAAKGAIPRPNEVYELQKQIENLDRDIGVLQTHKAAVEAKNATARKMVEDYRIKYTGSNSNS